MSDPLAGPAASTRADRVVLAGALVWTVAVVALTFFLQGLSTGNVTRLGVIVVLTVDLAIAFATRHRWPYDHADDAATFSTVTVLRRWVLPCTLRAAIVELCYMPSKPLYDSLRWLPHEDGIERALKAAVDITLTAPFYVVVFSVIWVFLRRTRLPLWYAVLVLPFAQALGDGNAFFLANPAMLLMAPYVVLNYVACQLVPLLRVRGALPASPRARVWQLLLPLLVVPATYWIGGALLIAVGRALGLRD